MIHTRIRHLFGALALITLLLALASCGGGGSASGVPSNGSTVISTCDRPSPNTCVRMARSLDRLNSSPITNIRNTTPNSARWRMLAVSSARASAFGPISTLTDKEAAIQAAADTYYPQWLERFASGVRKIPEVVELYRMSGDTDYLLKVLALDVTDYDRIYKRLIRVAELHDVSSSFAMEQIKYTTEVPLTGLEEQ